MAFGAIADAFVRLRVDSSQVARDTAKGVEEGAAAADTAGAGQSAGGKFSQGFASQLRRGSWAAEGDRAGKSFGERFGAQTGAATRQIARVGFVAIGAAMVGSVVAAQQFQSAMLRIHTQAGGTSRDVQILSREILGLRDVQQSPIQLANAMYHLKSVGLDNVDAMKALRAASDLAAVGGANLEETTNAIAGAWRSGIRGAQSFGQAAATVNAIVGAGNMRMGDFINAVGTGILPAARTFGLSLKDVGAALALMTDEGIPAQVAATRLRMTFSLMAAPSKTAEAHLESIGLTGLQVANAMRSPGGIVTAIGLLKKHLDASGLSASQQAILLSHAFGGGRSSSAILTLLNNYEVLRRKQEQINHSLDRFGPAVVAQRKTASAQWHILGADLERIGIIAGSKLLPIITKVVGWLANSKMLLPIIVGLMAVFTVAILAQAAAWVIFNAATLGIVAGVVAIIAGIILLATHWKQVWGWMRGWIMPVVDAVKRFALAIYNDIEPALHTLAVIAKGVWFVVWSLAKIAFTLIFGFVLLAVKYWQFNFRIMAAVATWLWQRIIGPQVQFLWHNIIKPVFDAIRKAWDFLWGHMRDFMGAIFKVLVGIIQGWWNVISAVFGFIINGAAKAFGWVPGLGPKLKTAAAQFDSFRDRVNAALNGINGRTITLGVALTQHALRNAQLGPGQKPGGGLAAGGFIREGTTGTADDVPIWASRGEYMVKAAAVAKYGTHMMDAINAGRYAQGGLIVQTRTPSRPQIDSVIIPPIIAMAQAFARQLLAALAAAARGSGGAPGGLGGPASAGAAQAQAYARSRLGAYGWGPGQMPPLIALWNGESGWNRLARNPSSGAYGIPQALPPGKMGPAANPPTSSAAAQINWGLGFIKGRYGSPGSAYGSWLSRSPHWYDQGGWMPPGLSLSYNGTGGWERLERVTGSGSDGLARRLDRLIDAVERVAPGVADGINAAARSGAQRGYYATR